MRNNGTRLFSALAATALLTGCGGGGGGNGATQNPATGLRVSMTDAPGNFQHVDVTISEISTVDNNGNITVINTNPQTLDLLALKNIDKVVATADLPPGNYSQIRLKVTSASVVDNTGKASALTVPSGAQSGLKLIDSFVINANQITSIVLDFDVEQSVVQIGNVHSAQGIRYLLKPVIRVVSQVISGQISGTVVDAATSQPIASNDNPIVTAYPAGAATDGSIPAAAMSPVNATDGSYSLVKLLPGDYDLYFTADGYTTRTLAGVHVSANATTTEPGVALQAGSRATP